MHIIFIILLIFLLSLSLSIVGFSLYTGISPMPSSRGAKRKILSACPKNPHTIYELGSGWGGVVFALAKEFPCAQLQAFEISFLPWAFSIVMQRIKRYFNLKIHKKNFFLSSLEEADVVICYLYPRAMRKLKLKFEKELKSETWVISNTFAIHGWIPYKVIQVNDIWKSEIFVYRCLQQKEKSS